MTMFKRFGVILLVAIGGASCLELGEKLSIPRRVWAHLQCRGRGWPPLDAG